MEKTLLILLTTLFVLNCRESSNHRHNSYSSSQLRFENGTYCAEVHYYYPKTGTSSTYLLEVELENDKLTILHWPNGGWLDSSHFSPPTISSGEARFTSDSNAKFKVRIIGDTDKCL